MALSRGRKSAITRQSNARNLKAKARVNNIIRRMPQRLREEIRAELAAAAEKIVAEMRDRVPVDQGDLRGTIRWRYGDAPRIAYSQGAGGENELSVRISAGDYDVRYAHLVEFGARPHTAGGKFAGAAHPGAPAQPFFYPAIRGNKRAIDRAMNAAVRRAVKKAREGA